MTASLNLFANNDRKIIESKALYTAGQTFAPYLARNRTLDRTFVRQAMMMAFMGSDVDGVWSWKQAYESLEIGQIINARRLTAQLSRLEDSPKEVVAMLSDLTALGLTHTRRSEEMIEMDQFSTPLEISALAALAAQIREGDLVLEPSAGNGMLAIMAEVMGGKLHLNELAQNRHEVLTQLFKSASITRLNALQLQNLIPTSGSFDVALMNPPFTDIEKHLRAAMSCLADNGRMVAIVPTFFFDNSTFRAFADDYAIRSRICFPDNAFYKHGTTVDTAILIADRSQTVAVPALIRTSDHANVIDAIATIPERINAKPRQFRSAVTSFISPALQQARAASSRLKLLATTAPLTLVPKEWSRSADDQGLYSTYSVGRMDFDRPRPHPSDLVESAAMASTPLPAPKYAPILPEATLNSSISDVQLEAIVYAGQAHSQMLPGWWKLSENSLDFGLAKANEAGAFQMRQGFFIADGTGVGKGTEIAGLFAENFAQGRTKGLWISKNSPLIEDARRDLARLGFEDADIVPLENYKLGAEIRLDKGIVFTTYATLRGAARNGKKSRLQQILDWLGEDFDGLIAFDEAHEMGNAVAGAGTRGKGKASQQGMTGLLLQYRAPQARVVYVSATGATEARNLSYTPRLGLWGGPEAPFNDRHDFLDAAHDGGVAFLELVAREMKAKGLYISRMLSFAGVEIEPITHNLTPLDVEVYDKWACAFETINNNVEDALRITGIKGDEGNTLSGQALSAARSAFASTSQRFFNSLLTGLKAPSVIQTIRAKIEEGMSAVVQIVSTNEATLNRRLEQIPPSEWNDLNIDLSPRDIVTEYLNNAFPVAAMETYCDEEGNERSRPLLDGEGRAILSQEALALREETLMDLALLPAVNGALDAILMAFGTENVAEITGRSRRVITKDGVQRLERRGSNANLTETEDFNSGRKRILMFSNAGGTGRSYHADKSFANQQRRFHVLIEPGFRADAALQGIGRTHRSNQLFPPVLAPVTTDIKGEKRFTSTIARRLDSLGAISKGERRAASNGMFKAEDSLENEWASRAKNSLLSALYKDEVPCMTFAEFEAKTGLTLSDAEGCLKSSEDLPPMSQFLNRLLQLRIADQNALFEEFDNRRLSILEKAQEAGQLDMGIEDLVADALELIEQTVILTDENGSETHLCKFDVRRERKLISLEGALLSMEGEQEQRFSYVINGKSGKVGLAKHGIITLDSNDIAVAAVRVFRPDARRTTYLVDDWEESNWSTISREKWEATWRHEHSQLDPYTSDTLWLATGQLLPIWKHMPKSYARVRRLKAPDGRQWLGRILHEAEAIKLLSALGVDATGLLPKTANDTLRLVISDKKLLKLSPDLYMKASRIMDNVRLEINGNSQRYRELKAMGCFTEIINGTLRVFVPTNDPALLTAVIEKFPVIGIEDREF